MPGSRPLSILQILLLRDPQVSQEMGESLWAAFKEVEAFYNDDTQRAVFRRFYFSKTIPDALEPDFNRGEWRRYRGIVSSTYLDAYLSSWETSWEGARGRYSRTYDKEKLSDLARDLLTRASASASSDDSLLIVVDQEITPPEGWRYVIWSPCRNHSYVVSIAPNDPKYWRIEDPDRIAKIKHRVRTACLSVVGELMGLNRCEDERCFRYKGGYVDAVSRLDMMVYLGNEHNMPALAKRGFAVRSGDPRQVQKIEYDPQPEGRWLA